MTEEKNSNHYYRCPHCACIFATKADLQKHMNHFGSSKADHEFSYRKAHGRLEHGYGEE